MGSQLMYYLKSLFFIFFVVFFANHVLPGIDVASQTKLPHVGGDLIFAASLGFVNSLIYPLLKLLQKATIWKIAAVVLVVNFVSYALLKFISVGIHLTSFQGYLLAAGVVSLGSFLINFVEMKHYKPHPCDQGSCYQSDPFVPPKNPPQGY